MKLTNSGSEEFLTPGKDSDCLETNTQVTMKTTVAQGIGFDQLCWHNFRIIGTYSSGISSKMQAHSQDF